MPSTLSAAPMQLVDALAILLEVAAHALGQVPPEALTLVQLLEPLPVAERSTLLIALQREVDARVASLAAGDGALGALDPTAQLFVRVFEHEPPQPMRDNLLLYRSSLDGFVQFATHFPAEMTTPVLAGVTRGIASLSDDERAAFRQVLRALEAALLDAGCQDAP